MDKPPSRLGGDQRVRQMDLPHCLKSVILRGVLHHQQRNVRGDRHKQGIQLSTVRLWVLEQSFSVVAHELLISDVFRIVDSPSDQPFQAGFVVQCREKFCRPSKVGHLLSVEGSAFVYIANLAQRNSFF